MSCAGPLQKVRIRLLREDTLMRAGFKPLPLTTAQQEQQIATLPSGEITTMKRQGKVYFLYPDLDHHRVLIGRNRQFMRYNALVTEQLSPFKIEHTSLDRDWEESGVWKGMDGWDRVGW